jgi:NADPH:quinone reductase
MRAWQVSAWGEPEAMTLAETAMPRFDAGEVLLRNRAAGINFFDLLQVRGGYQIKPPFPFTPGAEVCGIVEALGEGVTDFALGDRVVAFTMTGGFGEFAVASASRVFRVPPEWSDAEAAAFPVVYHTGWYVLERRARLQPGETLLVNAGASGVGMAAIQIGKAMGARVLATAGSGEKLAFARACGADEVIDYTAPDWPERVKALTGGRGADVIYEPVGGEAFDLATKCIAPEGRVLVVGFASGKIPTIAANRVLIKNFSVVGAVWGAYALNNFAYLAETHEQLLALGVKPRVTREYALEELPAALRDVDQRRVVGKVVVRI